MACLTLAKDLFEELIHEQGDQRLTRVFEMTYGGVALHMYSRDSVLTILYSEALSVLMGISLKMAREGYESRRTRVLRTGDGNLLGSALVLRAFM